MPVKGETVRTGKALGTVLLLPLLAGCFASEPPPPADLEPPDMVEPGEVYRTNLTQGEEWKLIRVTSLESARLAFRFETRHEFPPGVLEPATACAGLAVEGLGTLASMVRPEDEAPGPIGQLQAAEFGFQANGQRASSTVAATGTLATKQELGLLHMGAGERRDFLIFHDDLDSWNGRASLHLELDSNQSITVQSIAQGQLDCWTRFEDLEADLLVRSPGATELQGGRAASAVDSGFAGLLNVSSDMAGSVQVVHPDGTLLVDESADAGGFQVDRALCVNDPGTYELRLPSLRGSDPKGTRFAFIAFNQSTPADAIGCQ